MNTRKGVLIASVAVVLIVAVLGVSSTAPTASAASHAPSDVIASENVEPNDGFENATNVTDGYYADLEITDGDTDFYAVELDQGDELEASIYFSHATGDLDMRVYDETQEQLLDSTSATDNETITLSSDAGGTYFVEVYGFDDATAPYDLGIRTSSGLADAACSLSDTEAPPGTTVFLDASDSENVDLYTYDKEGDGTYDAEGSQDTESFPYQEPGTYQPRVQAVNFTDDSEDVADCGELTIDENEDPDASLTFSPVGPASGETVTFDGTGSTDPDGDDLVFTGYDIGNDGSFEGGSDVAQPYNWTFEEPGTYEVRLEVEDEHGATGEDIVTVDVGSPVTLACSVSPGSVTVGEDVTVDATESEGIDTIDVDIDGDETFERENVGLEYTYQYEEPGGYAVFARAEYDGGTEFATCGDVAVEAADPTLPSDMSVTVTDPWTDYEGEESTVTFETVITADGEPYEYGEYGSPDATHFEVAIGGASVPTEDLTLTEQSQDRYTVEAVVPVESIRGYGLDVAFTDEKAGTEATVEGSANILVPVLDAMEGTGTRSAPYVVTNATELQAVDADRDGHVRLGTDVDASETEAWFGGAGFIPIGREGDGFNGTFDGDGHTISGLTIDRGGQGSVGLFHTIGAGGVVENVTLAGVDVVGEATTGALAGTSRGTVRWSGATGEVAGGRDTGGLVGRISETTDGRSVFRSYAAVNVTGGYATGGLVGYNGGGRIVESFATGDVDGGEIVGGLLGYNFDGVVVKSYAQGDVHGDRRVAGLVGENQHAASTPGGGLVNETYATGRVTATEELTGGLVATETIADIENSYWDTEATGQEVALGMDPDDGNYLAGKLRTVEMQGVAAESNMSDFDFDDTWRTVEGDYPRLQWADGIDDDDEPPPGDGEPTRTQVTDPPGTTAPSPADPGLPLSPELIGGGLLSLAGLGGGYYAYNRVSSGSDSEPPRPPKQLPDGHGLAHIETGTISTPVESGTVSVTGLGFEPDLIVLSASNVAAGGGGGPATDRTDGWAHGRVRRQSDGTLLQSTMALADDGRSIDAGMGAASDGHALELLVHHDDTPERVLGTVTNTTSDGFEISFDTSGLRGDHADAEFAVLYKAFGFRGEPQISVGHFRTPDVPGTQTIDLGIDADHVMLFATNTVDDVDSHLMTDLPLGFSVGDVIGNGAGPAQLTRTATAGPSIDGSVGYAAFDDRSLHLQYGYDGAVRGRTTAAVTALSEGRMSLKYEKVYNGPNKLDSTDSKLVSYVAMNTGDVQPAIGHFQLPEPGSDEVLVVDLGFRPSMVEFQSFAIHEMNAETVVDAPVSFGWSEGSVIADDGDVRHQVLDETTGPSVPSPGAGMRLDPGVAASVRTIADGGKITGRDDVTVTRLTDSGFEMVVTDIGTSARTGEEPRPLVFYKAWPQPIASDQG